MPEWMIPWIIVGLVIYPLILIERWIHRHVQGLGLLISNDPQVAVLVYYIAMLPGVILHEASQWLLAQILRVPIKNFQIWPDQQKGQTVRLGLVDIEDTDSVRATLIGVI
ncbi:MAG: hypothetical protein GYB68_11465, partial [Chloroflexi bacterium]|nr:hypothetical protein [Chloroflexota bacterium]